LNEIYNWRQITLDDTKEVLNFYIRNREAFREWEPIRNSEFFTLEKQREIIDVELEEIKGKRLYRLWLFEGEKVIGAIALSNIVYGCFLSCNLGYKIDENYQNRGLAQIGIRKIIEIAFNELGLHRIEANIMPKNKKSIHIVEKLGFEDEGYAKRYLKINGKWEDHIHFVILNEKLERR